MGTGITAGVETPRGLRSIPTTGMRGGLGRTLLTAFLILTILPLALIGGYAAKNNRDSLQKEVKSKLQAVATLKGEELRQWLTRSRQQLLQSALEIENLSNARRDVWWATVHDQMPDLLGVMLVDQNRQSLWTAGVCSDATLTMATSTRVPASSLAVSDEEAGFPQGQFVLSRTDPNLWLLVGETGQRTLVFCLSGAPVARIIQYDVLLDEALIGKTGKVYLIFQSWVWPDAAEATMLAEDSGSPRLVGDGAYVNHLGVPVIGAYYHVVDYDIGVLVEQAQSETLESTNRIAATLIALVLAVALATTIISAFVIRQITRPVIRLTESAVAMAEGDLAQHLEVTSRDEIGILTYVFNDMAADLKSLYEELEEKVAERTQRLQQANYQIQRRALHLQASQDVGQAITSIRDPALLLNQVADLIRECFVYASVAVYIVEPGGGEIRLRALSPAMRSDTVIDAADQGAWRERVYAGDGSIIERAVRKRKPQIDQHETDEDVEWYRRILSRVAIPLRMEDRISGVLAVLSTEREGIHEDELEILEMLGGQLAIALENARAYERERLAAQRLEEAEVFKGRFLANMSHALREPLNTIIGFSRLMIKGIDGAMTLQQVQDLERIYDDGQRLLFLINDILAISQIQAGMMELRLQEVTLQEIVDGMMPTASALVRGKDIELVQDIPESLPVLNADPARLRHVLVHLLNNAAKFTEHGEIAIKAWCTEDLVYVSVSDTGVGIPPEDFERLFARFEKGMDKEGRWQAGLGLGLALSKEFVEMHGGQMWVTSEVGKGSTFTFSMPCHPST
ncbi:MAG: GAF domain-containing protein, partial [Anaerolineae bacterium]|nr:GAF domain-containing protein [Anaerolineae bacterium]